MNAINSWLNTYNNESEKKKDSGAVSKWIYY